MPFEIRVQPDREVAHIEPVGELDIATVERLGDQLDELVESGFAHVVVDLRALEFIDVSGLRLLLNAHAAAQRDGWRLSLIQGPDAIRHIFAITDTLATLPFESPAMLAQRGT